MATQKKDEQNGALESRVRQVVAQGTDVQAAVRQLTLDAMSNHALSLESIGGIMHAVVQGTREGVQEELDKTQNPSKRGPGAHERSGFRAGCGADAICRSDKNWR